MRIAHLTDIHWFVPPGLADLTEAKRFVGLANLYLAGRRHHFDPAVQDGLVAHLLRVKPELVVITGDLTSTASEAEFRRAREVLEPVLDRFPTFVIAGNHDAYTTGAVRADRIGAHFGPWMHRVRGIQRLDLGEITVLGLDPCRPTFIDATGYLPEAQLAALAEELRRDDLDGQQIVIAIHYPILDRRGALYGRRDHRLINAEALVEVLRQAPRRPRLLLHGHEHHGFRVPLDLGEGPPIEIMDCGSSGYAWEPHKKRAGATTVIDLAAGKLDVERYLWDGEAFGPEPGGAFATGR
jgi:3',5'-cyclic AMP phosphodiesterase CpdA